MDMDTTYAPSVEGWIAEMKKLIAIRPYNRGYLVLTYKDENGEWQEIKEKE